MLSVRSLFAEGVMTLLLSVLFLTLCAAEICSAAEVDEDTRHLLKKNPNAFSHESTKFVVGFFGNFIKNEFDSSITRAALYIATSDPRGAKVDIEIPEDDPKVFAEFPKRDVTIQSGIARRIDFPVSGNTQPDIRVNSISETKKGILIESKDNVPITVIGLNDHPKSVDIFLALPCRRYSEGAAASEYKYFIFSTGEATSVGTTYSGLSQFLYIACEDNTRVDITLSDDTTDSILRSKYTTHLVQRPFDLTGSVIVSNGPLAVFTGQQCGQIPSNETACDVLVEQIPPHITYGQSFFALPIPLRQSGEMYRIGSFHDDNRVTVTCTTTSGEVFNRVVEDKGKRYFEFYTNQVSGNASNHQREFCCIETSRPSTVMQYALGHSVDSIGGDEQAIPTRAGDPAISYVPPITQYRNNFIMTTAKDVRPTFLTYMSYVISSEFFDPMKDDAQNFMVNGMVFEPDEVNKQSTGGYIPIHCNKTICGYGAYSDIADQTNVINYNSSREPDAAVFASINGIGSELAFSYPSGFEMEPIGLPHVSILDAVVYEGDGEVKIDVIRTGGDLSLRTTVFVDTRNATALSGEDYESVSAKRFKFNVNSVNSRPKDGNFTITILDDDVIEDTETFEITFVIGSNSDSSGYAYPSNIATVTILDDDGENMVLCRPDHRCEGSFSTSTIKECCDHDIDPFGLAYTIPGVEGCQLCPVDFGFNQSTFSGIERGESYRVPIKLHSGQFYPGFTIILNLNLSGTAGKSDVTLLTTQIKFLSDEPQDVEFSFNVDSIAQELEETFAITFEISGGRFDESANIRNRLEGVIIDSTELTFELSEVDYVQNEEPNASMEVLITKSNGIELANPVYFRVTPLTVEDALARGAINEFEAENPFSPNRANYKDFDNNELFATFPVDEGHTPVTSIELEVSIEDDNIDEADEQVFIIFLEIINATNLDVVKINRTTSIGRIKDDETTRIGFEHQSYNVTEPNVDDENVISNLVYLVRENHQRSEQTYSVDFTVGNPRGCKPATIETSDSNKTFDFSFGKLDGAKQTILFTPSDDKVPFVFTLNPDSSVEETECFEVTSTQALPICDYPIFQSPSGETAFASTLINIIDNDVLKVGFEQLNYTVSESDGVLEVCVVVINPPPSADLDVTVAVNYRITEVSSSCTKLRPFLSNAKQFPSSRGSPTAGPRRQCFTVSITDNDIAENTELISLFLQEDTSFSHTGATIDPDQTKVTILDDDGGVEGKCTVGVIFIVNATTPEARLEVTKTFLENIDPVVSKAIADRLNESSDPLKTAYSTLVERYGRKETETGFREFIRAIDEISIAQAEACSGPSPLRVSNTARLVREYNAASTAKNVLLQRSTIGRLLCVDSRVTTSPVPVRGRRDLEGNSTCDNCTCPCNLTCELFCPCQFFRCLDPNDIFESIFKFNSDQECLAFVIDTTGSMYREINATKEIILNFTKSEEEIGFFGCYVLVSFNDIGPDGAIVANMSVGPIIIADTYYTEDLQKFYNAVIGLETYGGGDYEEYSLFAMLKVLRKNNLDGVKVMTPGSQMVVITDAPSKQPELASRVITEANALEVCIHFFLSENPTSDIYQNIADNTSGTVVPFTNSDLGSFVAAYSTTPCQYIVNKRRKRAAVSPPPTTCQSLKVTEFAALIKLTITAKTGQSVTITRPNGVNIVLTVGAGDFTVFSEGHPIPGTWRACVSSGSLTVSLAQTILLDTTIVYLDDGKDATSVPPPACTGGKIAVLTSQADRIQEAKLELVDRFGDVKHSFPLSRCSGALISDQIYYPPGSFIYRLVGKDCHKVDFNYDTKVNVTFLHSEMSYTLHGTGPSVVELERDSIAELSFTLISSNDFGSKFSISTKNVVGYSSRVTSTEAEVAAGKSTIVTVQVRLSSSTIASGSSKKITLIANNGCVHLTASKTVILKEPPTTVPVSDCGCLNGGTCVVLTRRGRTITRCGCPSGFSGTKCQIRL